MHALLCIMHDAVHWVLLAMPAPPLVHVLCIAYAYN